MLQKTRKHTVSASSLAAVKLFSDLPFEAREKISEGLVAQSFERGQQIVAQNDGSNDMYFILGGSVRATYFSGNGKEVAFADLPAGEMFGVLSALDDLPRSIEVVALSESLIVRMCGARFQRLFNEEPEVAMKIVLHLAKLVRCLTERVVEFSTLGVRNRIHAELLRLANDGQIMDNRAEILLLPTHAEIANRVATHREAVTRELNRLEKEVGLVDRTSGKLCIRDVDKLRRIVRNVTGG